MTFQFRVHPDVIDTDLGDALSYYGDIASELGARIAADFQGRLVAIREQPLAGREVFDGFRRRVLRDFPYLLIYHVHPDEVLVLALVHGRRRPAAIRALIAQRGLRPRT